MVRIQRRPTRPLCDALMLIDTHAHIYLDVFDEDLSAVIDRAREAGIDRVIMPAIDVPSIHRALDLSARYDGLYAMAALHPSETNDATDVDFDAVAELCDEDAIVAVGETGLDYYWDRSFDERQQDALRWHIRIAIEKDLPLVFHNREAFDDLVRIVDEERTSTPRPERLRGVFHCFTGTQADAGRIGELGFVIGIGGILTFKNSQLGEEVRDIPLSQIVLETDSPYLAPHPHRGKRNEPAFTRNVAEVLANIKRVPLDELASATTATAERVFGL